MRGFFIRTPLNTEVPRGGTRAFYALNHTELFIHEFSDCVIFAKIIATRDALPPIYYIITYSLRTMTIFLLTLRDAESRIHPNIKNIYWPKGDCPWRADAAA